MKRNTSVAVAAMVSAFGMAPVASAETGQGIPKIMTMRVPVMVRHMDSSLDAVGLKCYVGMARAQGGGGQALQTTGMSSNKFSPQNIVSLDVNGNANVVVEETMDLTRFSNEFIFKAAAWSCDLMLRTVAGDWVNADSSFVDADGSRTPYLDNNYSQASLPYTQIVADAPESLSIQSNGADSSQLRLNGTPSLKR